MVTFVKRCNEEREGYGSGAVGAQIKVGRFLRGIEKRMDYEKSGIVQLC